VTPEDHPALARRLLTMGAEVLLLPAANHPPSSAPSPESAPFLLVRASSRDVTEVSDEYGVEETAAKSVPPHVPPVRLAASGENDLPSVIVDLRDLEAGEQVEAQRKSELDGLLASTEDLPAVMQVPLMSTPLQPIDVRREQQTLPAIDREPRRARSSVRGFALGLIAAVAIGGGALGAFLHLAHRGGPSLGSLSALTELAR